jgi:adhesin/invasin
VTAAPTTINASSGSSASTITVTVRDRFDNLLSGVDVTLAVTGTGSGNTLVQPTGPTGADGVATGKFSSTTVGSRTITATAGGVAVEETATVTVGAGGPSASASSATVPGGRVGQSTTIEVLLKDALGNSVSGAASAIVLTISGANNVGSLPAGDQGGGRYTVRYTPQVAGTDQVAIRVAGVALAGSPFPSQIASGATSASRSTASVPARVSIFTPFTITITARDQFGNQATQGGDPFELRIDGGPPRTLTDNGNGTYQVTIPSFSLSRGDHQVFVTLGGADISGSPYPLEITFP